MQLWFTDVLGTAKTFAITPAELENALEEGMTFDGSAIDGFSRVQESDVLARPDAKTFQILPWHPEEAPVARVFCDIFNLDGTPFYVVPATSCVATSTAPGNRGSPSSPPLRSSTSTSPAPIPRTLRSPWTVGRTSSSQPRTWPVNCESAVCSPSRRWASPSSTRQHEDAPSQHEIDLRYTDALTMADTVMTVRFVVKETASKGVHASFMPKPLAGVQGSGMHTHLSLFEGDTNAFDDPDDAFGLSEVAKRFTAGVLRHAHEITAITNQWVNSYKRLVTGYEAPIHVSWARNNRSALVCVPVVKRNKHESTRIEYRAPDTSCNPYLAFAVILAAGLKGVEEGYDLPREAAANLFTMTPEELAADGIQPLPGSLNEAVAEMERSDSWPRPSVSTCSSGSSGTSERSGRPTRPTSVSSSSTATSRCSRPVLRPMMPATERHHR